MALSESGMAMDKDPAWQEHQVLPMTPSGTDEVAEVICTAVENLTAEDILGFAKGLNPRSYVGVCGDALDCVVSHYMEQQFPDFEFMTVPNDTMIVCDISPIYDGRIYFLSRDAMRNCVLGIEESWYDVTTSYIGLFGYRAKMPKSVQSLAEFFDSLGRGASKSVTAARFVREVEKMVANA